MKKDNTSYNQILKSTTIFGGSQVITILIGLIRTKIIAVLLGTMGIGLIGILQSVIDIMRSTYSLGMDTSGVKEIAMTSAKGDKTTLERTVSRFNLWFRTTALLALLTCIVLGYPISNWAFGNGGVCPAYSLVVGLCILCSNNNRTIVHITGVAKDSRNGKNYYFGKFYKFDIYNTYLFYLGELTALFRLLL